MTPKNKRRVGDQLKSRRQDLQLSLHNVEVATKIRGRYLRAIEASDYDSLPNDVYSLGFVRQYATYLGLPADKVAASYKAERGDLPKTAKRVKPRPVALRFSTGSRLLISMLALSAIGLVAVYLAWQFSALSAPPHLTLNTPTEDLVVEASSIKIAGTVASGADVFLNDSLLPSDVRGRFETTLVLQPGVNEVRLTAKSKLGKQTQIVRHILSKQTVSETLPGAPFDGVAVLVSAKQSVAVKFSVDGKPSQTENLVQGASKLIQATTKIRLTFPESAEVSVKFTNKVVAGADYAIIKNDSPQVIEINNSTQPVK